MSQFLGAGSPATQSQPAPSPVPIPTEIAIEPGPVLLAGISDGAGLAAHRQRWGPLRSADPRALIHAAESLGLRGRGGAGFPFAVKFKAVAEAPGRRSLRQVVVNFSEGEPVSAKDTALALTRPHLALDGAVAAAVALHARTVHVVVPSERSATEHAIRRAVAERPEHLNWQIHLAEPRFVAGQARAVIELMEGRANLPVTSWQPEAISGYRGRPTLLSNAETWAHLGVLATRGPAAYGGRGSTDEPGTTLLTLVDDRRATGGQLSTHVVEVEFGARWRDVLDASWSGRNAVIGGFHGAWATWETLASARVSPASMRSLGIGLGAGAVWMQPERACPIQVTAQTVAYLAGQSARRCGPCFNGLPALAETLRRVAAGSGERDELQRLAALVTGRGACAHPDGTARLVRSLVATFPAELSEHALGRCPATAGATGQTVTDPMTQTMVLR